MFASVFAAAAPAAQAQGQSLTVAQQDQVSALATKIIDAIRALPPTSSPGAYMAAIYDAANGVPQEVVEAAVAQVSDTPGLPPASIEAAKRIKRIYAYNPSTDSSVGYFVFGSTPGLFSPGFVTGGGGGTTSSYTR
jgi:hypothetical protein